MRLTREESCAAAAIQTRRTMYQGITDYDDMAQQWDNNQVQPLMTQVKNALDNTEVLLDTSTPKHVYQVMYVAP
jgi:hypothetical protein